LRVRTWGGGFGLTKDETQAVYWLRKAAEQGNADAQGSLGWMYARSKGVPLDYTQAASWARKAAEQGNADARVLLDGMNAVEDGEAVEAKGDWPASFEA
jgi:TPR repeat protein